MKEREISLLILAALIASGLSGGTLANGPSGDSCTRAQAMAAEKEAAYLGTWRAIYDSYRRFRHCDDGAIATGYTESVVRALSKQWNRVVDLDAFIKRDPGFERFVLRHVSSTALSEDLQAISEQATKSCPLEARELCKKLAKQVTSALSR